MSQGFDPYHKWLGIPPEERPPSHYRLLGIPLYEADQEVIASAAVQRMNWLRKFQSGENGTAAQRLTKEIADAWACLLNQQRRQEYDQQLKTRFAGLRNTVQEAIEESIPSSKGNTQAETLPPFLVAESPAPVAYSAPPPVFPAAPPQIIPPLGIPNVPPPVFSTAVEPPASSGVVIRTGGRRFKPRYGRRKPSLLGTLLKQIGASFLGLAAGYFILCQLGPQYDFLHLFSKKNSKTPVGNAPPERRRVPRPNNPNTPRPAPPKPQQPPQPKAVPSPEASPEDSPMVLVAPRFKIPDDDEQKRAKELVSETYKAGFEAAQTREKKIALAGKILKDALETKDPPTQYVALRTAQAFAQQGGEIVAALEISEEIATRFEVDSLKDQLAMLSNVTFDPEVSARMQDIAKFLDRRWDDALDNDRFDIAAGLSTFFAKAHRALAEASQAEGANPDSQPGPLSPSQDTQLAEIFSEAAKSFEALADNSDDPTANASTGRFLCFVLNKWDSGVIRLSKGDDEALRDIAILELAPTKAAPQRVEIADRWMQLATKDGQNAGAIRQRAASRYRAALPDLTGVDKTRAENRIAEIESLEEAAAGDDELSAIPPSAEGVPKTAAELEQRANQCRTAKEALALYQEFLDEKTIPEGEKELANRRFPSWAEKAAKDDRRMGIKWVPPDEFEQAKKEAVQSTSRALAVLHSEPQECIKLLEKAARLNADTIQPDFVLGVLYAVVGHEYKKAQVHFQKCLARQPQNAHVMNNLAMTKALSNKHPAAVNLFRTAFESAPNSSLVAHNVRRAAELSARKIWTVTPSSTTAYKKSSDDFLTNNPGGSTGKRGWLYLLPPVEEGEIPYAQLLRGRHQRLIVDDECVEDRACVACSGFGQVTCGACVRGWVSSQKQVSIGKSADGNTHYKTIVVRERCNACGGDGTVDCRRCTGGIDPDF